MSYSRPARFPSDPFGGRSFLHSGTPQSLLQPHPSIDKGLAGSSPPRVNQAQGQASINIPFCPI
jgi:hypothetical protein